MIYIIDRYKIRRAMRWNIGWYIFSIYCIPCMQIRFHSFLFTVSTYNLLTNSWINMGTERIPAAWVPLFRRQTQHAVISKILLVISYIKMILFVFLHLKEFPKIWKYRNIKYEYESCNENKVANINIKETLYSMPL